MRWKACGWFSRDGFARAVSALPPSMLRTSILDFLFFRCPVPELFQPCFPVDVKTPLLLSRQALPFLSGILHRCVSPNKAPEPTTTAVTPRAIVSWCHYLKCEFARGAPAVAVAHL